MPEVSNATWSNYAYAPRWAKLSTAIRDLALITYVDLEVLEVEKGLIREHIRFRISGNDSAVRHFRTAFFNMMRRYNET